MIEFEKFEALVKAADQAGFIGNTPEELSQNLVDAKELAEKILKNEIKLKMINPKYIPILESFLGLSLSKSYLESVAEENYNRI